MIIGTGIDLVDITRIENAINKFGNRFINKILTPYELELIKDYRDKKTFVATRFAVKEATSKALGTGMSNGLTWKHIELRNNERGKPYILLYGEGINILRNLSESDININVSISHEKKMVVAIVIIEAI